MTLWLLVLSIAAAASPAAASASVASGDFDGNGVTDVAIGVPFDDVNGKRNAGSITVLYGAPERLNAVAADIWHQDVEGVCCAAEPSDRFGSALAAGNFDGDNFTDLAIGTPYEDQNELPAAGKIEDAGQVNVLYGTSSGLDVAGSVDFAGFAVGRPPRAGDRFGFALAAGNFDLSDSDDLGIGVPYADVRPKAGGAAKRNAGAVHVFYGRGTRGFTGVETWTQNSPPVGTADAGDHFGSALAAANFGLSPEADLAIGVPFEDVGQRSNAGTVNVLYGSPTTGLGLPPVNFAWHQNSANVDDKAQAGDRFGSALAAANLGRSPEADLAIGVPNEDVEDRCNRGGGAVVSNAGAVNVLYGGGPVGLAAANNQVWCQNKPNIKGSPGVGDRFGAALSATDLVLAIGVPFESADGAGRVHAGAVSVLYGNGTGSLTDTDDLWHRDSLQASIPGATGAQAGDRFGTTLAAAPVAPPLRLLDIQLVIGAPFVDIGAPSITDAGAVNVLYRRAEAPAFIAFGAQEWTRNSGLPGGTARAGDRFGW